MANIVLNMLEYEYKGKKVETYAHSIERYMTLRGHKIHKGIPGDLSSYDLFLDFDCGRDTEGRLSFIDAKPCIPSAAWFIDSHGYPDMHRRLSKQYDHVFFAVWDKRDIFSNHSSAHWCPNATDSKWFNSSMRAENPEYDFGFFGSKKGLSRASRLQQLAISLGRSTDVRQICPNFKHRWPHTAHAMGNCKYLFNHGQKHDGPNLRVMESMAMNIPLLSDEDHRSGMNKLFTPWEHYVPYEYVTYSGLKYSMEYVIDHPDEAQEMANKAYQEVMNKHLIEHRVDQILEVCLGNS